MRLHEQSPNGVAVLNLSFYTRPKPARTACRPERSLDACRANGSNTVHGRHSPIHRQKDSGDKPERQLVEMRYSHSVPFIGGQNQKQTSGVQTI